MPPTWTQNGFILELRAYKKSVEIDLAAKIFLTCPPKARENRKELPDFSKLPQKVQNEASSGTKKNIKKHSVTF